MWLGDRFHGKRCIHYDLLEGRKGKGSTAKHERLDGSKGTKSVRKSGVRFMRMSRRIDLAVCGLQDTVSSRCRACH